MKKFLLSSFLIVMFTIYAVSQHIGGPKNAGSADEQAQPSQTTATVSLPLNINSGAPAPQSGLYKDGTYTGASADAYYGNIQVQAVIKNGKIADIRFLDYPQDRNRSIEINSQAMPYLKSEAISAQSAQVDVISGATATSQAFRQSLASALSQAS